MYKIISISALLWGIQCCLCQTLFCQNKNLHQYDVLLENLSENNKSDSFLLFAKKKMDLCKSADSLELWAAEAGAIQSRLAVEPKVIIAQSDAFLTKVWRSAKTPEEAASLMHLHIVKGYLYKTELGLVHQALKSYNAAFDLEKTFQNVPYNVVERLYKPMGNLYTRLGDNDKAIVVFKAGLQKTNNPKSLAGLYDNLALAYWNKEEYAAAEKACTTGLAVVDAPNLQLAYLNGTMATLKLSQSDAQSAEKYAQKALVFSTKAEGHTRQLLGNKLEILHTLSKAFLQQKKYDKAAQKLKEAQKTAQQLSPKGVNREAAKLYGTEAKLAHALGNSAKALQLSNQSLMRVLSDFKPKNSFDSPKSSSFYAENSILEALTDKATYAFDLYKKSGDIAYLKLAEQCHDLAWKAEIKLRSVYIYTASKLFLQAQSRARDVAAMEVYHALYSETKDQKWAEKAFSLTERSRAMVLLEALQEKISQQRLANNDIRFDQVDALQKEIAELEQENRAESPKIERINRLDSLQSALAKIEHELKEKYNNLPDASWFSDQNPRTKQQLGLHPNETLLAYFIQDSILNAFVFAPKQAMEWQRLPFGEKEKKVVFAYLAFFKTPAAIGEKPSAFLNIAFALREIILPQTAKKAPKLLIIPDGILAFLPYDALVTAPTNDLQSAQWLVQKTTIREAYSYSSLLRQVAFVHQPKAFFLGFAPVFAQNERGQAALLTSPTEWTSLGFFTNKQTLLQAEATKIALQKQAENYQILHLATHAIAKNEAPRIECIDDALWLSDIYSMDLQADLVVLSACETGIGEDRKGEGVLSLARAFTIAGASATLSGLWQVNEQATTAQASRFYTNMKKGLTTAEALQDAKLAYLSDKNLPIAYQTPYYWAAMVLTGVDTTIDVPFYVPLWVWGLGVFVGALCVFFFKRV